MHLPDLAKLQLTTEARTRYHTDDPELARKNPNSYIYWPQKQRITKRKAAAPSVYHKWTPNDVDDRSLSIRQYAQKHNDDPRAHVGFFEAEISCALFVKLTAADQVFGNAEGEPAADDWRLDDPTKHKIFTESPLRVDQPWLDTSYNKTEKRYEVNNHEGRHRAAWVCNHMHFTHMTVVVGVDWENPDLEEEAAPRAGTRFLEQSPQLGNPPTIAMLETNDREDALTKFRLV